MSSASFGAQLLDTREQRWVDRRREVGCAFLLSRLALVADDAAGVERILEQFLDVELRQPELVGDGGIRVHAGGVHGECGPDSVEVAESSRFYPDSLWWVRDDLCWAIDPTGQHLLDAKVRGKLIALDSPRVALVTEGHVDLPANALSGTEGWSLVRARAALPAVAQQFESLEELLASLANDGVESQGRGPSRPNRPCTLVLVGWDHQHRRVARGRQETNADVRQMTGEVAAALARFFEQTRGPSHDELTRLFERAGLRKLDPATGADERVGKMKRVRGVLLAAAETEPRAAMDLARELVAALKGRGCFDQATIAQYAGPEVIASAQRAFAVMGWTLDPRGDLYPASLAGLEGRQLTDALVAYVRRIQRGGDDAALTIGSDKDLLEAAARHILVETAGEYSVAQGFPATLVQAAATRGIAIPPTSMIDLLDRDATRGLQQALILAAIAINRLRNSEGTGHGRPHATKVERVQGRLAAETAAAVCYLLLPDSIN